MHFLLVENQRLKTDMADLTQQNERRGKNATITVLYDTGGALKVSMFLQPQPAHTVNLVVSCVHLLAAQSKDAELKRLLEMKDLDLERMKEKLDKQEKARQSELLQLQLEVSELLHHHH